MVPLTSISTPSTYTSRPDVAAPHTLHFGPPAPAHPQCPRTCSWRGASAAPCRAFAPTEHGWRLGCKRTQRGQLACQHGFPPPARHHLRTCMPACISAHNFPGQRWCTGRPPLCAATPRPADKPAAFVLPSTLPALHHDSLARLANTNTSPSPASSNAPTLSAAHSSMQHALWKQAAVAHSIKEHLV